MLGHDEAHDAELALELTEKVEGRADVYLRVLQGARSHARNVGTICLLAKRRHVVPILLPHAHDRQAVAYRAEAPRLEPGGRRRPARSGPPDDAVLGCRRAADPRACRNSPSHLAQREETALSTELGSTAASRLVARLDPSGAGCSPRLAADGASLRCVAHRNNPAPSGRLLFRSPLLQPPQHIVHEVVFGLPAQVEVWHAQALNLPRLDLEPFGDFIAGENPVVGEQVRPLREGHRSTPAVQSRRRRPRTCAVATAPK